MKHPHEKPYDHIVETIGWTPLIRVTKITGDLVTPIYAKAEFLNPGGSIKDRIGLPIIEEAERKGELKPGGVIVEGTSGNTGVALAMAAAMKGYRCIFTMPDKMSHEKVKLLRAYGAEVVVTPTAVPPDHPESYFMKAQQIVADTPNSIFANQFYNEVNSRAHYETSGPEIWRQTEGKITHFVAGAGTGGYISGVARFLKEQNPDIRVISPDPVGSMYGAFSRNEENLDTSPYKLEGVGGDKIPGILAFEYIDEFRTVSDPESFQMARRITREEGMFVGGSSGFNMVVALQVAAEIDDPEGLVVTVFADTGERYLSKLYSDDWMRENQMMESEPVTAAHLLDEKRDSDLELVVIAPNATVRQAINLMSTYNVSQLPVIAGTECVGSVTESLMLAKGISNPRILENSVEEHMDPGFPVIDDATTIDQLSSLLSHEVSAAMVKKDGELTGIITRHDVLRHKAGIR